MGRIRSWIARHPHKSISLGSLAVAVVGGVIGAIYFDRELERRQFEKFEEEKKLDFTVPKASLGDLRRNKINLLSQRSSLVENANALKRRIETLEKEIQSHHSNEIVQETRNPKQTKTNENKRMIN